MEVLELIYLTEYPYPEFTIPANHKRHGNFIKTGYSSGQQIYEKMLIITNHNLLGAGAVLSDSPTPWTVVHQASRFMEFSRQEYLNGLPFPSPEDLPDSRSNSCLFHLLHCQMEFLLLHLGSPLTTRGMQI